jgi:phosphomevalonate kinase
MPRRRRHVPPRRMADTHMRLSVPGNLLLLGEYAVLEEGGLGLAMAVERRVRLDSVPAGQLRIDGSWPGGAITWTRGQPAASPLVAATVFTVEQWLGDRGIGMPESHITIDSADFFLPDGRKTGLGSSAAVTVALTCALLEAAGRRDAVRDGTACRLAVQGHRRAQGGAGSGYDAVCSFHGGLGLFRGGAEPAWEACDLSWRPAVKLFAGPAAVSTTEAVRRYAQWKARSPAAAREYLAESNRAVLSFVSAPTAADARQRLSECARLGMSLGRSIGVPADIAIPSGLDARWCKAAGAGNELGLCLFPTEAQPAETQGMLSAPRAAQGVTWEE